MLFGAPTNLAVAYLCQKFAPCLSNIAAPVPTKLPYTHDGEALGIGVKFWEGGVLVSVLVAFQLTAKSQGGSEIAQVLLEVLMEQLDVKRAQLLSSARDGVAANSVAMSLLSAVYKNHVTLLCMPHGCNNIGGAAVLLFLTNIVNLHTAVFKNSPLARLQYGAALGLVSFKSSYSKTRWWTWADVVFQIQANWRQYVEFMSDPVWSFSKEGMASMRSFLAKPRNVAGVHIQAALTADRFTQLYACTYITEGDGPGGICIAYHTC